MICSTKRAATTTTKTTEKCRTSNQIIFVFFGHTRAAFKIKARFEMLNDTQHRSTFQYVHSDASSRLAFSHNRRPCVCVCAACECVCEWMHQCMNVHLTFLLFVFHRLWCWQLKRSRKRKNHIGNNNNNRHRSNWSYVILLGAFEWIKNH